MENVETRKRTRRWAEHEIEISQGNSYQCQLRGSQSQLLTPFHVTLVKWFYTCLTSVQGWSD